MRIAFRLHITGESRPRMPKLIVISWTTVGTKWADVRATDTPMQTYKFSKNLWAISKFWASEGHEAGRVQRTHIFRRFRQIVKSEY